MRKYLPSSLADGPPVGRRKQKGPTLLDTNSDESLGEEECG